MASSGAEGTEGAANAGRLLAGRYRLVRRLGRGGMGVVWHAVDEVLRRHVAVKELRTFHDAAPDELAASRRRMRREARAAARVRHPGVIAVYDVVEHAGRPHIVMELVDGPSLQEVLRERGRLAPGEAAAVGARVLEALTAAHDAGVLHRDVKPGNILLGRDGRVVLTDFGIAALEDAGDEAGAPLTRSGELVGSIDYLAPERARGEPPRPASDLWALGTTLYAAVEGVSPFRRTSTWTTLHAIVTEPLPPARRAGPLAPVLAELMDKDPARRADAARAARLLHAVARGAGERPAETTLRLGRSPRRARASEGARADPGGADRPAGPLAAPRDLDPAVVEDPTPTGCSHRRAARRRWSARAAVAGSVMAVLLAGAVTGWSVWRGDDPERGAPVSGAPRGVGAPDTGVPDATSARPEGETEREAADRKGGPRSAGPESERSDTGAPAPGDGGGPDGALDAEEGHGGNPGSDGDGDTGDALGSDGQGGASEGDTSDEGGPSSAPACRPLDGDRYVCAVWATADTYDAQHAKVGTLYAGPNYFYCQKRLPHRETHGRWTNVWWAKTDDDTGNTGVYVSGVYLVGGANDAPVPGLPRC